MSGTSGISGVSGGGPERVVQVWAPRENPVQHPETPEKS